MPVPKKIDYAQGQGLTLTPVSKFCVTAPAAEYGPVKGATEKLTPYLMEYCGADCFGENGTPITLTIGTLPEAAAHVEGGY